MNAKQMTVLGVMVAFGALTVVPVYQYGLSGFFDQVLANSASIQVLVDLVIALTLFLLWMFPDARRHGISPVPYVVITVLAGSFGPLLYLFKRFGLPEAAPAQG
jgi:hypothetical protein